MILRCKYPRSRGGDPPNKTKVSFSAELYPRDDPLDKKLPATLKGTDYNGNSKKTGGKAFSVLLLVAAATQSGPGDFQPQMAETHISTLPPISEGIPATPPSENPKKSRPLGDWLRRPPTPSATRKGL
eukprot:793648-Prymnesium_polylepis.1